MSKNWVDPEFGPTQRAKPSGGQGSTYDNQRPHSAISTAHTHGGVKDDHQHRLDGRALENLLKELEDVKAGKVACDKRIGILEQELQGQQSEMTFLQEENSQQNETISRLKTSRVKPKDDDYTKGRHDGSGVWYTVDDSSEMRKIKGTMRQLNSEVEGLEMEYVRRIEELERQLSAKSRDAEEDGVSRYKRQMKQYETKLKEADENYKDLEDKAREVIERLKGEKEQLEIAVKKLREETTDLSDRLAQEMNVKVSADESNMENISISSRPMKIAESYSLFCTTEWFEIKNALDEKPKGYYPVKELEILETLCKLLMVAHNKAFEFQKGATARVLEVLDKPLDTYGYSVGNGSKLKCPQQLSNGIGDFLRATSETTDLSKLEEGITDDLYKLNSKINSLCRSGNTKTSMEKYIKGAATLAWKMVNQRPMMTYRKVETNDIFDNKTQEPHWGSVDPKTGLTIVDCCIVPALCHGDRFMTKAKVLLKLDDHHTSEDHFF